MFNMEKKMGVERKTKDSEGERENERKRERVSDVSHDFAHTLGLQVSFSQVRRCD